MQLLFISVILVWITAYPSQWKGELYCRIVDVILCPHIWRLSRQLNQ